MHLMYGIVGRCTFPFVPLVRIIYKEEGRIVIKEKREKVFIYKAKLFIPYIRRKRKEYFIITI
jgi:hypothetical protein